MESATLTRPTPGHVWLVRLRAVPAASWAKLGFLALCTAGVIGFFVLPTYPIYDSYYALIWGRDVIHAHLPHFQVYRAPTEHPLAIAFGAVMALFGSVGDRLMIFGAIASFVALVAGVYRLGRISFGPVVGWVAAALLCTRFDFASLAAKGYLDIPYLALVVWAAALEAQGVVAGRGRRGTPVFVLLALAGLLRPDAWLLAGLYFLWCAWPASWSQRIRYAALTASAPLIWALVDAGVTGDPAYSLHSTSGLAEELGRTQGLGNIPTATWNFMQRLDKLPLVVAAMIGLGLAIWLVPRRVGVPAVVLFSGLLAFFLIGAAGASVIDRYLLLPAVMVMLFGAVAIGGWSLLEPGGRVRRAWILGAASLVAYGVLYTASSLSLDTIRTELAFRNDSHTSLARVLEDPVVRGDLARCGPLSLPNHKLLPDARWILDRGPSGILARSQARTDGLRGRHALERRLARAVAIYPTGDAVFRQAIVDSNDDPRDQVPPLGFRRALTSQYYAVYVHC